MKTWVECLEVGRWCVNSVGHDVAVGDLVGFDNVADARHLSDQPGRARWIGPAANREEAQSRLAGLVAAAKAARHVQKPVTEPQGDEPAEVADVAADVPQGVETVAETATVKSRGRKKV